MSGEKWTAGPWRVDGDSIRCNPTPNDDGRNIADMVSSRSPEETTANARLIAAAPDLYEALRSVPKDDLSEGYIDRLIAWWQGPARAALAKARGER